MIDAGSASGLSNLASFSTGSGATSYSASGVASGVYYVRVRAANAAGTSGASNEVLVTIGSCGAPPSAPANLTAQVAGTSVALSWTAASGSPTSYVIEAGSSSGGSNLVVSDTGTVATTLTATAAPGTYYVRVRARNSCGTSAPSTEIVVVVGSVTGCVTISPTSQTVGDGATVGSVAVSASSSCTWTATSNNPSFLTVTSGASGTGSGTVSYSVSSNTQGSSRTGTLTIGGHTFTVIQNTCSYAVSPPLLFDATGGTSAIAVTTPSGCAWTTQNGAAFVTITSPASGTGSGSLSIDAPPNTGFVRGGTLVIGSALQSATTTVVQDGAAGSTSCVSGIITCHAINCSALTVGGEGRTAEVILSAPATCAWIAAGTVPWIATYAAPTLSQPPFGVGNGHFGFSVAPNPLDTQRLGGVSAGGYTFPITQLACSYSVSPASVTVLSSGGTGVISVTTSCTTPWSATSNASFMTITGAAGGTGNGTVSVTVAPNSGPLRTGTLTIAGQTVTVTQSAS